jgi:hypothetical protein
MASGFNVIVLKNNKYSFVFERGDLGSLLCCPVPDLFGTDSRLAATSHESIGSAVVFAVSIHQNWV